MREQWPNAAEKLGHRFVTSRQDLAPAPEAHGEAGLRLLDPRTAETKVELVLEQIAQARHFCPECLFLLAGCGEQRKLAEGVGHEVVDHRVSIIRGLQVRILAMP